MSKEKTTKKQVQDVKESQVCKSFEEKKRRNNTLMLDKIPKWVCVSMCFIVGIQTIGLVVLLTLGALGGSDIATILANMLQVDLVGTGIAIIAIAVSAWVGLNIYVSISREELDAIEKNFEDEKEKIKSTLEENKKVIQVTLDDAMNEVRKQNNAIVIAPLQQIFIDQVDVKHNQYVISGYFAYLFKNSSFDYLEISFITKLIQKEGDYILQTNLYEEDKYESCFELSGGLRKDYEEMLNDYRRNYENISSEYNYKIMVFYLRVRISDAIFYRNASCKRINRLSRLFDLEAMTASLEVYEELIAFIQSNTVEYIKKNILYAYINNTIGYTYDLMNQVEKDEERVANAIYYMEKSVEQIEEPWLDKKARYLRNLGLTFERDGRYEDAEEAYMKSVQANKSDNKSWNNAGAIIVKRLERALDISERDQTLHLWSNEKFVEWKSELEYAESACKMAISLDPAFMDPYYKLIQIYTYLYLVKPIRPEEIQGASNYIEILKGLKFEGAGYLFAYRNYFEAMGDIKKANEINESIAKKCGEKNNDVGHIRELYKKTLENGETSLNEQGKDETRDKEKEDDDDSKGNKDGDDSKGEKDKDD